eukprot:GHVN01029737.1.p1 GENE.GHVN01029737.1~~GHVN01029737.1.p1  ORF type:complete len:427 (-),score=64.94 GHVN01029737.1:67-1347(-)
MEVNLHPSLCLTTKWSGERDHLNYSTTSLNYSVEDGPRMKAKLVKELIDEIQNEVTGLDPSRSELQQLKTEIRGLVNEVTMHQGLQSTGQWGHPNSERKVRQDFYLGAGKKAIRVQDRINLIISRKFCPVCRKDISKDEQTRRHPTDPPLHPLIGETIEVHVDCMHLIYDTEIDTCILCLIDDQPVSTLGPPHSELNPLEIIGTHLTSRLVSLEIEMVNNETHLTSPKGLTGGENLWLNDMKADCSDLCGQLKTSKTALFDYIKRIQNLFIDFEDNVVTIKTDDLFNDPKVSDALEKFLKPETVERINVERIDSSNLACKMECKKSNNLNNLIELIDSSKCIIDQWERIMDLFGTSEKYAKSFSTNFKAGDEIKDEKTATEFQIVILLKSLAKLTQDLLDSASQRALMTDCAHWINFTNNLTQRVR